MNVLLKNRILVSILGLFICVFSIIAPGYAGEGAWEKSALVVKQNGKILVERGKCDDTHAPFSTFKIALALMGFDADILQTKDSPLWAFREEYEQKFPNWYTRTQGLKYHWCQDHTPASFMMNSVLWFSHQITERLGKEKFQEYVSMLEYGNRDVSGTPGKDDGLLNAWLGTSLQISPREQIEFLEKLFVDHSDLSKAAQEKTREVMNRNEEWNGWKLYGKTGGGTDNTGWFIGWVERDEKRIIFAQYLDMTDKNLDHEGLSLHTSIGTKAKEVVKANLLKFLGQ